MKNLVTVSRLKHYIPNADCSNATNETIHNSSISVSGTNSTTEASEQSIQLISNPVHERASFRINTNEKAPVLKIVNNLGVIVLNDQIEKGSMEALIIHIDVSHLPPRLYYYYFEHQKEESEVIKFIKH